MLMYRFKIKLFRIKDLLQHPLQDVLQQRNCSNATETNFYEVCLEEFLGQPEFAGIRARLNLQLGYYNVRKASRRLSYFRTTTNTGKKND